jgi:hypothetical protein
VRGCVAGCGLDDRTLGETDKMSQDPGGAVSITRASLSPQSSVLSPDQEAAIDRAFRGARVALAEQGLTEAGLQAIGDCLRELAQEAWLHDVPLPAKHGGASSSRMLRSDGLDDLTLTLARFPVEAPTPVQSHQPLAVSRQLSALFGPVSPSLGGKGTGDRWAGRGSP